MKVGVLGASGMLGSDLVEVLAEEGIEPVGAARAEVDVTDVRTFDRWVAAARPDTIVNCTAYTNVDGAETDEARALAVNGEAVGALAARCRALGIPLVHVSTDYVFGGESLGRPWRESDPVDPRGVYARTKLEGERAFVRELGEDGGLIARTQWLFGLAGRNFIEAISRQLRPGAALRVVNDQHGRPTWTRDLARGLVWLIAGGQRGIVHVANEGQATWFDVAARIVAASGVEDVTLEPQSSADARRPAPRPAYSVLDLEGFAARTGRRLPDWTDAVNGYLERRAARG